MDRARWGELVGLQRSNVHLDNAVLIIDPDTGSLHESSRGLELGPPKTAESARRIALPPFLVDLLRTHLSIHDHLHVFIAPEGGLHRRAMRPAADGTGTAKIRRDGLGGTDR